MINKIKYNAHLIIHSKYKLLIHLFVLSLIYLSLYNQKIAFCMMEDTYISDIVETSSNTNQSTIAEPKLNSLNSKIHGIIQSYLEPAREIEELTIALEKQQAKAQNAYDAAGRFQADYKAEIAAKQELIDKNREMLEGHLQEKKVLVEEIDSLQHQIKRDKDDYEAQIAKLTRKINRQKMEIRELRAAQSEYYIVDPGKY